MTLLDYLDEQQLHTVSENLINLFSQCDMIFNKKSQFYKDTNKKSKKSREFIKIKDSTGIIIHKDNFNVFCFIC